MAKETNLSNERLVELARSGKTPTQRQTAQAILEHRSDIARTFRRFRTETLIGFITLLMGLSIATYVTQRENEATRGAAHDAIKTSSNAIAISACNKQFKISLTQRRALVREHGMPLDKAARLTPLSDCRRANIVTDDPKHNIRKERPLHPGLLRGEWE